MLRCPPISTLFPYTTLFRSYMSGRVLPANCLLSGVINLSSHAVSLILDRKSTRLNSSHLVISYAVFCLKKKTKATGKTTAVTERAGVAQPDWRSVLLAVVER